MTNPYGGPVKLIPICVECERKDKRISELKELVKLADSIINGPDEDHWGLAECVEGYYAECFTEDVKKWDEAMEAMNPE